MFYSPGFGQHYIKGFLQGAVSKGFDASLLLSASGITPTLETLDREKAEINSTVHCSNRIHLSQLLRLWLTLSIELEDVSLGFLEEPSKIALEAELCRVISDCFSLGEGIARAFDFLSAIRNDTTYTFAADPAGDQHFIEMQPSKLQLTVDEHLFYFYCFYKFYSTFGWFIGKRLRLITVHFRGSEPEDSTNYELCFGCPVRFNQTDNRLFISSTELNNPICQHRNNTEWHQYIRSGGLLREYSFAYKSLPDKSFSQQVEIIIKNLYRTSWHSPCIEDVADKLNISSRTLRRRLKLENENWIRIKSRVRCDLATKLLETTNTSIKVIGERVGFAEAGDFSRAFSGWMDCTPTAYRESSKADYSPGSTNKKLHH